VRARDPLGLLARAAAPAQPKVDLVEAHADERHDGGPPARALAGQHAPAPVDLGGGELARRARRPWAEIRQADPVGGESSRFREWDGLGHEAGGEQEPPERVAVPREVVAERPRAQAWIDADEKEAGRAVCDDVAEGGHLV
jgi:hypothetical protein